MGLKIGILMFIGRYVIVDGIPKEGFDGLITGKPSFGGLITGKPSFGMTTTKMLSLFLCGATQTLFHVPFIIPTEEL